MAKPKIVESINLDPTAVKVESIMDYASRGWLYYSSRQYEKAVNDFRHVLEVNNDEMDAWYGLGLSLKAAGDTIGAVDAFTSVLGLIGSLTDKQRASVLTRLVRGQINQIKTGDWNLEKEVWKRS